MTVKNAVCNFLGGLISTSAKKTGTFLFTTAAVGWALSSAAQVISLLADKEIPKEDKKFLIPQEVCDCAFNIISYAAITLPLMFGAKSLANNHGLSEQAIEGANTIAAITGGVLSSSIITPVLRNKAGAFFKNSFDKSEKTHDKLDVVSKADDNSVVVQTKPLNPASNTPFNPELMPQLNSGLYSKFTLNPKYQSMNSFLDYAKNTSTNSSYLKI